MSRPSPARTPAFTSSDSRPRVYLRLLEQRGKPAIGYRTHPAAIERVVDSIELALSGALGTAIGEPAVLLWAGLADTITEA